MTEPAARIGAHLRKLRQQRGLTLQDVADRTGWERSRVSQIEVSKHTLRMDTVVRYCNAIDARIHIGLPEEAK